LDKEVSQATNHSTLVLIGITIQLVCDQAFGTLRGAEKWSRDITKIENLHIDTRRKINLLIPKMLLFSIYDEK